MARRGKSSARKVKRSLILWKADEGATGQQVAEAPMVGPSTVSRVRQRFVEGGLERALNDRPRPGQARRQDYEYCREGTRNLFLACEPPRSWRHVAITQRRTRQDLAHQMRWLVDEAYPEAQVVRLSWIILTPVGQLPYTRPFPRLRPGGS